MNVRWDMYVVCTPLLDIVSVVGSEWKQNERIQFRKVSHKLSIYTHDDILQQKSIWVCLKSTYKIEYVSEALSLIGLGIELDKILKIYTK